MRRIGRTLLVGALTATLPLLVTADPGAAAPTDMFGAELESTTQLPGLTVTEAVPSPAAAPHEAVQYLPDRDLIVVAVGQTFVVIDAPTFRVVHEESVAGTIVSIDLSDDGTTLVVAIDGVEVVVYETSLWGETDRFDLPVTATAATSVTLAPGTTDVLMTESSGAFSVIDQGTVSVPEFRWGGLHPDDSADVIWGNDVDTVYLVTDTDLHEVDISTGTPTGSRTLPLPLALPSTDPSLRPLLRVGDDLYSEWGFAVDPVGWAVLDSWASPEQRAGRAGTDTVIVRRGADVELLRAGEAPLRFTMPDPFATEIRWMIPLADARFAYIEAGGQLRFGDGELLASALGDYTAVTPERIFDTRVPIGQPERLMLGPGEARSVQLAGRGGVPGTGVGAVVVNVTAVNATEPTFVTVFPAGATAPNVSTVNVDAGTARPGAAVANLASVRLGSNGSLDIYNGKGSVDVILDVMGYYSSTDGPRGARFVPLDEPRRIADTRRSFGSLGGRLGADTTRSLELSGELVPAATAAVIQVTAIQPSQHSFVTVFPGDVARPEVSNINLLPARTSPNLVIVRVPADGAVDVYNLAGTVDIAVDLVGFYEADSSSMVDQAGRFLPLTPRRLLDTRVSSPFDPPGALSPASEILFPSIGASAETAALGDFGEGWTLVMNLTAVGPSDPGFLAAVPTDSTSPDVSNPTTSNVNFMPGQVRPNHTFVTAAPDWSVYNSHGYTHVLVDEYGYITPREPRTSIVDFGN